jgi:hypothetical protein
MGTIVLGLNFYPVKFLRTISQGPKDSEVYPACRSEAKIPSLGPPFTPLCPVKFMTMKSEAYFTGVAPGDGTGVSKKASVAYLSAGIFIRRHFGGMAGLNIYSQI